jgi:hypothetical protein
MCAREQSLVVPVDTDHLLWVERDDVGLDLLDADAGRGGE